MPPAPPGFPADPLAPEARPVLMALLRQAQLRHDEIGTEIIACAVLRNLCQHKLFEAAEALAARADIKMPFRSTNQAARYSYYDALVKAVRLDYAGAQTCLMHALRKAPERALGFRVAATKLLLVVQLLVGEIPARSEFLQPTMKSVLAPYLHLTSCVRFGHLGRFQAIATRHQKQFEHDSTYTLILRVRQNVIRMGLRRICQAYTRIALSDVCVKLALDNPDDAEYIVAKAVKDGVIAATLDHEKGHIVTAESADVYATTEPLAAFQKRTQFCSAAHDEARRSMRYATDWEDDEEERRRQQAAKREAMERAMEDDDGGAMDFTDGI